MHRSTADLMDALESSGVPVPADRAYLDALDALHASMGSSPLTSSATAKLERLARQTAAVRGWAEADGPVGSRVTPPIVVLGMPRSGSTMVHLLLSAAPRARPLIGWEAGAVAPSRVAPAGVRDQLRREDVAMRADLESDNVKEWHLETSSTPVEDTTILAQSLRCWSIAAGFPLDGYTEWLDRNGVADAYDWHADALARLDSANATNTERATSTEPTWVLHAPEHTLEVEHLLRVHPAARLVITWREPRAAMASLMDFAANERRFLGGADDVEALASDWVPRWAAGLRQVAAVRDEIRQTQPDRIFEVDFDDLRRDMVGTARSALDHFGLLADGTEAVEQVAAQHPQGDGHGHRYDPRSLGPVGEQIDDLFSGLGPG